MALSAKQTRNVQVCRKNVIPDPRCGAVCEAVMPPLYPAVKSNLRPTLKFWQKSDEPVARNRLERATLPALPLLATSGPTPRFIPSVGTDTTSAPGTGTNGPTMRNRWLHSFGLILPRGRRASGPYDPLESHRLAQLTRPLMPALVLRRRVLFVPLRLVHTFPLHLLG